MADPGGTKKDRKDTDSDKVNLRPNGGNKLNNAAMYVAKSKTGSVARLASKVQKGRNILTKKSVTSVSSITNTAVKRTREMVSPPERKENAKKLNDKESPASAKTVENNNDTVNVQEPEPVAASAAATTVAEKEPEKAEAAAVADGGCTPTQNNNELDTNKANNVDSQSPDSMDTETVEQAEQEEQTVPEETPRSRKPSSVSMRVMEGPYSSMLQREHIDNAGEDQGEWKEVPTKRRKRINPLFIKNSPPPQAPDVEFPVILQGTDVNRPVSGVAYKVSALEQMGIRVKGIYPISGRDRLLVSCVSKNAQHLLTQVRMLARVPVSAFAPKRTTTGVIRGVPFSYSDNQVEEIVKISNDNIHEVRRLYTADQKASRSVRITFNVIPMPKTVKVDGQTYRVDPFVTRYTRCTKCQEVGHFKKWCQHSQPTCRVCGERGHSAPHNNDCPNKDRPCCVNCGEAHPSSYWYCSFTTKYMVAQEIAAVHGLSSKLVLDNLGHVEKFSKDKIMNPWSYSRSDFLTKEKEIDQETREQHRLIALNSPRSPQQPAPRKIILCDNFLAGANGAAGREEMQQTATSDNNKAQEAKVAVECTEGRTTTRNETNTTVRQPVVFAFNKNMPQTNQFSFLQRDEIEEKLMEKFDQKLKTMEQTMERRIAQSENNIKNQIISELGKNRREELNKTLTVLQAKAVNSSNETEKTIFGFLSALVSSATNNDFSPLQDSMSQMMKKPVSITEEMKQQLDTITHAAILRT